MVRCHRFPAATVPCVILCGARMASAAQTTAPVPATTASTAPSTAGNHETASIVAGLLGTAALLAAFVVACVILYQHFKKTDQMPGLTGFCDRVVLRAKGLRTSQPMPRSELEEPLHTGDGDTSGDGDALNAEEPGAAFGYTEYVD